MSNPMANEIWRQIPLGVKMSMGARVPVGSDSEEGCLAYLHFQVGNGRKGLYKVIVRLMASDTYDVQLVKIGRKDGQAVVLDDATDVYNDALGRVLLRMERRLG